MKLITHGSERVKLSFVPMGRYVIGGGGGGEWTAGASKGRVINEMLESWERDKAFKSLQVRGG